MKKIKKIKDKNITVVGAGLSGLGASQLACYLGANVTLTDINKVSIKNKNNFKNITMSLGKYPKQLTECELMIVSPGIDCRKNSFIKKVEKNGTPIISEIEFASWFTDSKIIAITGSNGKSTVVRLLSEILKEHYSNTMLGGNIGIPFSSNVLKELKNKTKNTIHVLEISSFQLEKVYFFKPDIACILNISKDHLNRYKNYNEYYNTKFKIFNGNKLFYNGDDKILKEKFKNLKNTAPFSLYEDNLFSFKKDLIIKKSNKNKFINISKINLIGKHNIQNIFAVLHITEEINKDFNISKKIIYNFKPLKHRMEKIKNSPTFINDSKSTNLTSTAVAVNSYKKNITLILGGYSKDIIDKKAVLNIIKKKRVNKVICYGDIGTQLLDIIKKYKFSIFIEDFQKAIIYCAKMAQKNEIILLSPGFKSFDQFNNFEERGNAFKKHIYNYYKK